MLAALQPAFGGGTHAGKDLRGVSQHPCTHTLTHTVIHSLFTQQSVTKAANINTRMQAQALQGGQR